MDGIKSFAEGAQELQQQESVGLVVIPNSSESKIQIELVWRLHWQSGIRIDDPVEYVPPRSVGYTSYARKEQVPIITKPKRPHIIVDDVIQHMHTMRSAIDMLTRNGVDVHDVWVTAGVVRYAVLCFTTGILERFSVLDRVVREHE